MFGKLSGKSPTYCWIHTRTMQGMMKARKRIVYIIIFLRKVNNNNNNTLHCIVVYIVVRCCVLCTVAYGVPHSVCFHGTLYALIFFGGALHTL